MILDSVEGLSIADDDAERKANELRTLAYLGAGLKFLDGRVRDIESRIQKQEDPNLISFSFGNAPALSWVPQGLLACAFHWYATSACNFVRLVGFLAYSEKEQATAYVKRVMPAVYVWRNKVAAHFAITGPLPEDTQADQAVSVMFPIAVDDGHFVTGGLTLSVGDGSTSRGDMGWSLTRNFEELSQRYELLT